MSRQLSSLFCVIVLGFIPGVLAADDRAAAPPEPLELLSPREHFGIVLRNTEELAKEGDELLNEVGLEMSMRPSQAMRMAFPLLGVKLQPDFSRPAGLFVLPGKDVIGPVVAVVSVEDRESLRTQYEIDPALEDLQTIPKSRRDFSGWAQVRGNTVFLLSSAIPEPVPFFDKGTLADSIPYYRDPLNRSDLLIHIGLGQLRPHMRERRSFTEQYRSDEERQIAGQFDVAFASLDHSFITAEVDHGLNIDVMTLFDAPEGSPTARLLREARGESDLSESISSPSLAGLPAEQPVAALTGRLSNPRQQQILEVFVRILFPEGTAGVPNAVREFSMSGLRQAVVIGAVSEVFQLSDEVRVGVYRNEDGTLAAVVILTTDAPQRVTDSLKELSDLLVAGMGDKEAGEAIDDRIVRRLIRELGAADYATRQKATTRLMLLGSRARPALQQASESDQREVAARARQILETIDLSNVDRQRRLLEDRPLAELHPKLIYHTEVETIEDVAVDEIRMELSEEEFRQAAQLEAVFGPEWDRIRIARTPSAVVLTAGAAGQRFDLTVGQLLRGEPGLEAGSLAELPEDPSRLVEAHLPIGELTLPTRPPLIAKEVPPSEELSAFGLSIRESSVLIQSRFPVGELRQIIHKRGWAW